MKLINFYRLKNLVLSIANNEHEITDFQIYIKSINFTRYTSNWKESLASILEIYEIRFKRYKEEDTGVIHNGFEKTINELRNYDNNFVCVHTFYNDEITYTIFTDTRFKKVIGIIQHINKHS